MEENTINFKGFVCVDGTKEDFNIETLNENGKMYLIRTDEEKNGGYIYFNNKKYGTEEKIDCGSY